MRQLLRPILAVLGLVLSVPSTVASAAKVRGTIDAPAVGYGGENLGYTNTKIAAEAKTIDQRKLDVALFLKVKTSLPLAAPAEHAKIRIAGYELRPAVAACAVDGKVTFENAGREDATLHVGATEFAKLGPGESKTYECTAVKPGEDARVVRVLEWPHMRGMVYVGEVGVVGTPDAEGAFALEAPTGQYELQVVGPHGVLDRREVVVSRGDVSLGKLDFKGQDGGE